MSEPVTVAVDVRAVAPEGGDQVVVDVFVPHAVADVGAGTGDLTLYRLPDSGRHHVVSPNRDRLFERLLSRAAAVLPEEAP